jgi:hypothetical protein
MAVTAHDRAWLCACVCAEQSTCSHVLVNCSVVGAVWRAFAPAAASAPSPG